ncbi:MAG: alpha/beta hydrolase [Candidatus Heimdallarchaeota archaeon]|nr:alpha/beta hydrolase [Candidatus Heimdallarchaeota archaeon]
MLEEKLDDNLHLSNIKEIDYSIFTWLEIDYVKVEEGLLLRIFKIPSENKESKINVIVVPGLCSHFLGWINSDHELSKIANIYHIESREKNTAKHSKKKIDYKLETFAEDLNKVITYYNLNEQGFYLLGDSLGAEIAALYMKTSYKAPKGMILISPAETFSFSGWMKILFRFAPAWLYYPILPLLKLILKHYRTDMVNDPGTYYLNKRNLETGIPKRMKACAIELFNYKSEVDYSSFEFPVYIFAASNDKMHSYEQSEEITKRIPNVIFENVLNFQETHSRETASKMSKFILEIEKGKK